MRHAILAYALLALVFVALADTGHLAILLWKIETFVPHGDWLVHFAAAGAFALLANLAFEGRSVRLRSLVLPVGTALACLLGTAEELLQGLSPHRRLTMPDLLSNLLGALVLGTFGMWLVERRRSASRALASEPVVERTP